MEEQPVTVTVYIEHLVYNDVEYMFTSEQKSMYKHWGVEPIEEIMETEDDIFQFAINIERLGYKVSGSGYNLSCVLHK